MKNFVISAILSVSSLSAFSSSVKEVEVQQLTCDIVAHPEFKSFKYAGPNRGGEMTFFDHSGEAAGDHWDAFFFFMNTESQRLYVVYHDGGEANETFSDAYIDVDGTGVSNQHPAEGSALENCRYTLKTQSNCRPSFGIYINPKTGVCATYSNSCEQAKLSAQGFKVVRPGECTM